MENKCISEKNMHKRNREMLEMKHKYKKEMANLERNLETAKKELEIEKLMVQKNTLFNAKKDQLEVEKDKAMISTGFTPELLTARSIAPHMTKIMEGVQQVVVLDGKNSTKEVGSLPWNLAMGSMFPDFKPSSNQHQITLNESSSSK